MLYLLSYRKMLMYDDAVPAFLLLWQRLNARCPKWPGFHADRMHSALIPELEKKNDIEHDRMERMLDVCKRRKEHRTRRAADGKLKTKAT